MKLIYIRPFGGFLPGDETEVPDGAQYSALYLAEPDHPQAKRAVAGRLAASAAEPAVVAAAKAAVSKPALTPPATQPPKEGGA